jgi:3-hydroxybutyryl-CoA dehydrogenase
MQATDIRRVTVIGAGVMGPGIAQDFAAHGFEVHLYARSQVRLDQAVQSIRTGLAQLESLGQVTSQQAAATLQRIRTGTVLDEAAAEADLVVEALSEELALKQQFFRTLDGICEPRAILASTTSTLLPSRLASATQRPDRVLVTHFFNPPTIVPLVEMVRGPETSDETVATVRDVLLQMGKRPAVVQKELPGFIGNRLQGALIIEALSLVQRGAATPADIDLVVKYSFGRRLGVTGIFEFLDLGGLDTLLNAARIMAGELDSSTDVTPVLREKVERGELGVKSGQGFYTWTPESAAALRDRIGRAAAALAHLD